MARFAPATCMFSLALYSSVNLNPGVAILGVLLVWAVWMRAETLDEGPTLTLAA